MLKNLGSVEIIIIAVVIMVLFGAQKLPEFARGLGDAATEFKKGLKEDEEPKKSSSKKKTEEE